MRRQPRSRHEIVGLLPGELFVHQNVANVVVHTDMNCLSVLQYAVEILQVKHIIVCGHYGCGGVRAALEEGPHGLIDNWLGHIRDVYRRRSEELEKISDGARRVDRLCELNVIAHIVHVLDGVYGGHNDWVYVRMGLHLQIPGYLSMYAAYVDGKPAFIAWTYFPGRHFATLFGGKTLAEYRDRGLYTSLLHLRLKEIRERGNPFAVVETGPMSRPIVAKHGFQHLTTVYDYEWKGN